MIITKRKMRFILIVASLNFCSLSFSQKLPMYKIHGKIMGLKDGEKVTMALFGKGWDHVVRDSTLVKNFEFQLNGFVPEGPRLYWMNFDKHPNKMCVLLINNDTLTIKGSIDIDRMPPGNIRELLSISGSPADFGWASLVNTDRLYNQTMTWVDRSMNKIKDSIGFDPTMAHGIISAKDYLNKGLYGVWVLSYYEARNPAFLFFVDQISHKINHAKILKTIYDSLPSHEKQSFYGKILKEKADLSIDQSFPRFELKDTSGLLYSSDVILSKSKLTLVHFWATNSNLREYFQSDLRSLYKKYKSKGLQVVTISSDTIAAKWRKVLEDEEFPWHYNLSDLKGKDGVVFNNYKEYGLPQSPNITNVLINQQGRIVAWNVFGVELEWYIWSMLARDASALSKNTRN